MTRRQLAIHQKIKRLDRLGKTAKGAAMPSGLRCLDLFAGCGGMSLGFHTAGFETLGGVEIDPDSSRSFALNLLSSSSATHLDALAIPRDVRDKPRALLNSLLPQRPQSGDRIEDLVDVLVGGPPCQAFARVGRAKLRAEARRSDLHASERAWLEDERASLYKSYLDKVRALAPLLVVMENVPDIMNHGGENIAEHIATRLDSLGYETVYTLLNSAHYGVPQFRERMFLLAFHKDLGISKVGFPLATHVATLPRGYEGTRTCALKPLRAAELFERTRHIQMPPSATHGAPATSALQALSDLPRFEALAMLRSGQLKRNADNRHQVLPWSTAPTHAYQCLMREWPGLEVREDGTDAHRFRYLPRDYRIFRAMAAGDDYPAAHRVAQRLFEKEIQKRVSKGDRITHGSRRWQELEREFVPPYNVATFPNRWCKMTADTPARTLMAHLGKDSYSHIHYDSKQARTITVREAARLQSFPDGFRFAGSMNSAFRQIGNAVPPLLAYALALSIREQTGWNYHQDIRKQCGLLPSSQTDSPPRKHPKAI